MSLQKFNPQKMSDDHLLPATLLEMGDTLNFIETRKHQLRDEIKQSKIDAGTSKVSGLGAAIVGGGGLLLLNNPLGYLVAGGGLTAYAIAVFAQWLQTGKLQIMPLSSKTQADRDVELSGSTITGQDAYDVASIQGARDSIREDAAYLSDREKIEYELLHFSPEGLLSAMSHVHPTQRWACYQFLIDAFLAGTIQSYFANPQALRDVLGNPQIYTSHLPEASKRFPQYGLQGAGAIDGDVARTPSVSEAPTFQPPTIPEHQPVKITTQLGESSAVPVTHVTMSDVPAQSTNAQPKQLSFDQVLALPLSDRADHLMKLLAEYGCDLRKLSGRPTLAAGGLQRSGKTTLILLLAIFEKAKGQKVFYITRDTDLYPIAFDSYASGSKGNAVAALMRLSDRINGGAMGSLSGETWILDEFSSTAKEMPDQTKNQFWSMALTGFAKQGGRVRFIVHHKTASANGLPPGEAETFKSEVKLFWTEREELSDGTYQPSGQYELLAQVSGHYKETGETFTIPEWLKTDSNPAWHDAPCPVRSLLAFFPELDTRKGAIAHPLEQAKESNPFQQTKPKIASTAQDLDRLFNLPSAEHETEESVSEVFSSQPLIKQAFPNWGNKSIAVAAAIVDYMSARPDKDFTAGTIKQSVNRRIKEDETLPTDKIKKLLDLLVSAQLLTESNGKYSATKPPTTTDDYDF